MTSSRDGVEIAYDLAERHQVIAVRRSVTTSSRSSRRSTLEAPDRFNAALAEALASFGS